MSISARNISSVSIPKSMSSSFRDDKILLMCSLESESKDIFAAIFRMSSGGRSKYFVKYVTSK